MLTQYILFVLAIILFSVIYPLSGYYQKKRLSENNGNCRQSNKIAWYRESMLWAWAPTLFILALTLFCGYKPSDLGICPIRIDYSHTGKWLVYISIAISIIYFGYNIYSMIVLRYSRESREESAGQIPEEITAFLPVTKSERKTWTYVALTAGISEEIQYRGYLFFAMPLIFPNISIWIVLLVSSILFGTGHIYQGKSAVKPTVAGLFFGFLYIILNSILPLIVLHITQDMVVRNLLKK